MLVEDEWLWGWDTTPGIVSVCAEAAGHADVWRRVGGELVHERARFRPWLVTDRIDDFAHLGARFGREGTSARVTYRELAGDGALRFLVRADELDAITGALLAGASRRLGQRVGHVRDLGDDAIVMLPPEEQYLVATGRTYFHGLGFDDLARLQLDLETTGLDPTRDRVFAIAVRDPRGHCRVLEADE